MTPGAHLEPVRTPSLKIHSNIYQTLVPPFDTEKKSNKQTNKLTNQGSDFNTGPLYYSIVGTVKTVLSDGMIHIVIKWYHEKLIHPKITTLIKAMKSHFHIWGVENDRFKNTYSELNCEICLSTITLPKPGHYKHIKSFAVLERVQIDLTQIVFGEEDILSKNGYKWVLTVIDCFSKFAWAYPLRSKESKPICDILCELFLREGVPIVLQSDNKDCYA